MEDATRAVFRAVAYFDLLSYPLTTLEAWKWQWSEGEAVGSIEQTEQVLRVLRESGRIETDGAFWFLTGRREIVKTRHARHRVSIGKFKIARRFARLFALLPSVEGVAVCNSLGFHHASAKSDLDFFIITSPGAIWTTRFLTVAIATLFGRRPTAEHSANTLCLSFFASRDALNFSSLQKGKRDPYFVYWLSTLTPLFGRGSVWPELYEANAWAREQVINAQPYMNGSPWVYKGARASRFSVPKFLERRAERFQRRRFPEVIREAAASPSTDVVVTRDMLKFHLNDRREQYRERWEVALQTL